jgi:HAMP domain-containing protein
MTFAIIVVALLAATVLAIVWALVAMLDARISELARSVDRLERGLLRHA